MADYYVDISTVAAFNTRAGTSTGTCWYGLAGVEVALRAVSAGNTIWVKSDGTDKDCTIWHDATHGGTTGGPFTMGEVIDNGAGAEGVIAWDSGSMIYWEQISGDFTGNPTLTGQTSGAYCTLSESPDVRSAAIYAQSTYNTGLYNLGYIRVIGLNSSWVRDGTRVILDGNSHGEADYGIYFYPIGWWAENFECKYFNSIGCRNYYQNCVWINCLSHNNATFGFYPYYGDYTQFFMCTAHSNGSGFGTTSNADIVYYNFCYSYSNTEWGFYVGGGPDMLFGCVSHDNGTGGGLYHEEGAYLYNCVIDGEVKGFDNNISTYLMSTFIGTRFTNNTTAIDASVAWGLALGCFFNDNTADIANDTNSVFYHIPNRGAIANKTLSGGIPTSLSGGESNLKSTTSNDEGYSNLGSDDFNLTATAKMRGASGDSTNLEIDLETS